MAAFGFDYRDDPLGLGLKQRAREQRMATWADNPSMASLHSALGDDWDAWFQAADEATGGNGFKLAGGAPPVNTADPKGNLGTIFAGHSNQLRGVPATRASIRAMKTR